ncbi:MAG: hypothetical protein D3906_02195 [Candidatus Electrothrix sp. AUS1_2]|nr:hypothetical protein [Candidatus Electrothrix sp. AUS1_2]
MTRQRMSFFQMSLAVILSLIAASSFAYEKEINTLSAAMAEKIAKAERTSVAVVDFTDLEGNVTRLGRFIAEEFSSALAGAGKGFKVIDRTHLNSIIKEKKLSATGLIDPATARKLGEIIGVQALITGTLTPFGENVRVAVKVLDTATAEVIDAARGNIAKTQGIEELLGKGIAIAGVQTTTTEDEVKKPGGKQSQGGISGPFFDDFNMGPKPDWKSIAGNWTMANGKYTVTNIQKGTPYATFLKGKSWRNFVVNLDISPGYTTNISRGWSSSGWYITNICPRMISLTERVCFGMGGKGHVFSEAYWFVRKEGTTGEHAAKVPIETPVGQPVNVKIEVNGAIFTAYVNDTQVNQFYDTTFTSGPVGLLQWYENWREHKIRITFDNVEIKPLSD